MNVARVNVIVTAADIAAGTRGDADICPVALAIRRALTRPPCSLSIVRVNVRICHHENAAVVRIVHADDLDRDMVDHAIAYDIGAMMTAYDSTGKMNQFCFTLFFGATK